MFIVKALQHEVEILGRLEHENLVGFVGVVVLNEFLPPWIVSSWMENGKVTEYVRANPSVDRPQLVGGICFRNFGFNQIFVFFLSLWQVMQISKGLQYLHSLDIAHGDIKGVCYLFASCLT